MALIVVLLAAPRGKSGIMPQRLYDAADRGDAAAVAEFLREGDDANEAANDWAPLHVACFKGHFDAVKALLDGGADVGQAKNDGATPLHMACQNGHVDVVRLLIEKDADVGQADCLRQTPLDVAKAKDHQDVARLLLSLIHI